MSLDPITAGIDFAKELGGKLISHFLPDPAQAAEASMKLMEMEQNGELARMVNSSELFKAEVDDRKSAREHESAIATSDSAPYLNKIVTPVLALGTIVLTFILFAAVVFDNSIVDASRKDLIIYVLGALTSIDGMIISYYFGSSSSSVQKSDKLESLIGK